MKIRRGHALKALGIGCALYLLGSLLAPYVRADSYGQRLRISLERSLGRKVEIRGAVRYSLLRGPGLSAEDVVIHEDPSMGVEPTAYVDLIKVRAAFWPMLIGRFRIGSIRLEGATLNLAKSGDTWNFTSFANRSVLSSAPAIQVRNGRINFRFGDTKSIFYLLNADVDLSPPSSRWGSWKISCDAQAARTDKPALGLGAFSMDGRWYMAPEHVDLDVRLERTQLGELAVLMSGQAGGVHGVITSRLHLAGPLDSIGILGRLTIEDVHRWDLLPPKGQGWPMDIRGRLNLAAQQIELQSTSSVVPVTTRFRASGYLSRPRWSVTATWNRFPIGPVIQLAADMGAHFPPKLRMNGSIDGSIGYTNESGFQGELALHDTAVSIPDSAPVRFEQVRLMVGRNKVWLMPALVHTADDEQARLEATYGLDDDTLDLSISSDSMKVASLRAQAALAAVPWLEQISSGTWSGQLRYHRGAEKDGWTGNLEVTDAALAVPGLARPLTIASARAGIDGERVMLDRISAQAGNIDFTGDYRYEPGSIRPHRLRIRAAHADAADLEQQLMPALRRNSSLLDRALGRTSIPDWLRQRKVEGSIEIDDLELAGAHIENFGARLVWDVSRLSLAALHGTLDQPGGDRAAISGTLTIALGAQSPSYRFAGRVKDLDWHAGRIEAEGSVATSGFGTDLLAHLTSDGSFTGFGPDLGTFTGAYKLSWPQGVPRWRLTDVSLRTADGIYIGGGSTQENGRLLVVLTNGSKEMRMSGTVAALKLDDSGSTRPIRQAP